MKKSYLYSIGFSLFLLMGIFFNTSIETRNNFSWINLSNLTAVAGTCSEESQGPVCIVEVGPICCEDAGGWFIWGWRVY